MPDGHRLRAFSYLITFRVHGVLAIHFVQSPRYRKFENHERLIASFEGQILPPGIAYCKSRLTQGLGLAQA